MTLSFWEHVDEFRKTIIRCGLSILLGSLIAFLFHKPLINFFLAPIGGKLSLFNPVEGLLITFKLSIWTGCLASSPVWIYFLSQFFLPALKREEKRLVLPFLVFSTLFTAGGITFAYWVTLPVVTTFLARFNEGIGKNLWHLGETLNFVMGLVIVHGIVFELFVVLLLLIYCNIISAPQLSHARSKVIVSIFILAAILTPPDIFSQLLLATPMWIFFEVAILLAKFRSFKKKSIIDMQK